MPAESNMTEDDIEAIAELRRQYRCRDFQFLNGEWLYTALREHSCGNCRYFHRSSPTSTGGRCGHGSGMMVVRETFKCQFFKANACSAWRDAATAPKDGTEIIGKYGDETATIYWSDDRT